MALHIRDEETDRLVRTLAERRRIPLTEAVKLAVRNELRKDGGTEDAETKMIETRDGETASLWDRLQPLRDRIAARPSSGLEADKAFYDSLYED